MLAHRQTYPLDVLLDNLHLFLEQSSLLPHSLYITENPEPNERRISGMHYIMTDLQILNFMTVLLPWQALDHLRAGVLQSIVHLLDEQLQLHHQRRRMRLHQ